jgi:hypothetical protein
MRFSRRGWLTMIATGAAASAGGAALVWWWNRNRPIHERFEAPVEEMLGTFYFTKKIELDDPLREGEQVSGFEEWEGKLSPTMLSKLRSIMMHSKEYEPKPLPPPWNLTSFYWTPAETKVHFEVFIGLDRMITIRAEFGKYVVTLERNDVQEHRVVDLESLNELFDECMQKTKKQTYVYRMGEWEPL